MFCLLLRLQLERADIDKGGEDDYKALMVACQKGHEPCARVLIENGANLEAQHHGFTALMLACSRGHDPCARALIENGANLEAQQNHGFTALMLACMRGHDQCARALIGAGVAIDHQSFTGVTALMKACKHGDVECTRGLLSAKADTNITNNKNETALMLACMNDNDLCVGALAHAGADVRRFANGETPLGLANRHDAIRVCFRLISLGVVPAGNALLLGNGEHATLLILPRQKHRQWALAELDELSWSPAHNDLFSKRTHETVRLVLWVGMSLQRMYGISAEFMDVLIDNVAPLVVHSIPINDRLIARSYDVSVG